MRKRKQLFVLVASQDRVVAATVATVAQAGGYLAATTSSTATAARLAQRMVVDAAIIDLPANLPITLDTAVALQSAYPDCRIVLVCSPAQLDEAVMRAEECGLLCEYVVRPLSRSELLAKLAAAPGVPSQPQPWAGQLQAA
jgi:ActR/RegA family two-component response regulator